VLVFICAVGLQLFPRFVGAPVLHAERSTWGAIAISLALLVRLATQPMANGPLREAGLGALVPGQHVRVLGLAERRWGTSNSTMPHRQRRGGHV
jgi:hypothetical protein